MKVLVIQNCEVEGIGIFEEYLKEKGINYTVFHAYMNKEFPSVDDFDVFIASGTPISVRDIEKHEFLKKEWDFLHKILKKNKPYFGICFGGQIMAKCLGAKVTKNPVMEIGGYEVRLAKENSYFNGFPEKFPVFQWHGDTFGIPEEAELLVEGDDCKNQAFSYKNILGVQFHIEVTSEIASTWADKYSDELITIGKTKEQVVQECKDRGTEMKRLAYLLMDNFFRILQINHQL